MTVHFIGAGPGAPDLITLRGRELIARSPVVLYAGSLVPEAVIAHAAPEAAVTNTADLTLDEIVGRMAKANARGLDVARIHSGDPSLYGAIGEQMRRLAALGIEYDITPGVPAFAAAAAALGQELTLPEVSQTVILTRTAMRSTEMPNREDLETLARSGATLAIHLSARNTRHVEQSLIPFYGADCPVAIVVRASWPDQRLVRCRLEELHRTMRAEKIRRTALILVGRVLEGSDHRDSKLYDPAHFHVLRPKKRKTGGERGEFTESDCRVLESIIRSRRDVRGNRFIDREVPDALIDRLLEAAMHAPSVGYSQPWSFVVIRDAAVREAVGRSFERENERAERRFRGERESLYRRLKLEGIREAPVNIAVFYVPPDGPVLGQTTIEEVGPYSVVCAVQNMWLLGRALNLGIGWVSILDPAEVAAILGAPPELRLIAYLCVGYVEAFPEAPELETVGWAERKRKDALVHRDRYR